MSYQAKKARQKWIMFAMGLIAFVFIISMFFVSKETGFYSYNIAIFFLSLLGVIFGFRLALRKLFPFTESDRSIFEKICLVISIAVLFASFLMICFTFDDMLYRVQNGWGTLQSTVQSTVGETSRVIEENLPTRGGDQSNDATQVPSNSISKDVQD